VPFRGRRARAQKRRHRGTTDDDARSRRRPVATAIPRLSHDDLSPHTHTPVPICCRVRQRPRDAARAADDGRTTTGRRGGARLASRLASRLVVVVALARRRWAGGGGGRARAAVAHGRGRAPPQPVGAGGAARRRHAWAAPDRGTLLTRSNSNSN
jgi:hypothetical protein